MVIDIRDGAGWPPSNYHSGSLGSSVYRLSRASRATPAACLARGRAPSDSRDDKIVGPWASKPHAHKTASVVLHDCRSYPREAKMIDWRR